MRKLITAPILAILLLSTVPTNARAPTKIQPINDSLFRPVVVPPLETTIPVILEPAEINNRTHQPIIQVDPEPEVMVQSTPKPEKIISNGKFTLDPEASWYGPGFYGGRTACGEAYTKFIFGVAHRSLPCGTMVTFKYEGRQITVPVIDRGPYVEGRIWDLSGALCTYLKHCFTGKIWYRIE